MADVKYTNTVYFRLLMLMAVPSLTCGQECQPGITYLDSVTGHCDPCSDICEFTRQQGTAARCQTLCKGYRIGDSNTQTCPPLQYYDSNVDRCEPCAPICLQSIAMTDCRTLCPDWPTLITSTASHTDPKRKVMGSGTDVTSQRQTTSDERTSTSRVFLVVSICIGVLLVGCLFVAVLVFVMNKSCARKMKNIVLGVPFGCNKRSYQEEGRYTSVALDPIVRNGKGPFASPTEDI